MSQDVKTSPSQIIKATINDMKKHDIAKGLEKGNIFPHFSLKDQNSKNRTLKDLFQGKKFLIISFFRGRWCGYCRSELKDQNSHYEGMLEQNAELVAISPQTPKDAKKLEKELGIKFPILSDSDLKVTNQLGLVWDVPENIKNIYLNNFNLNIPELNANQTWQLPNPAIYIINQEEQIIFKYANLDYSKRVTSSKIIEFLHQYNQ